MKFLVFVDASGVLCCCLGCTYGKVQCPAELYKTFGALTDVFYSDVTITEVACGSFGEAYKFFMVTSLLILPQQALGVVLSDVKDMFGLGPSHLKTCVSPKS